MKFINVLVITVLITVSIGLFVRKINSQNHKTLISPLVAGASISIIPSPSEIKNDISVFNWPVFTNNYYGYKIKHPADVNIKNRTNGDVSFQKTNSVNILISQDVLSEKDTVNTIIESAIDKKKADLKDKFTLLTSISPVALSSATAQTYTSSENDENITYYYIPQKDKKYLLVSNYSPNNGSADYLTSEDIIYSLEFIP